MCVILPWLTGMQIATFLRRLYCHLWPVWFYSVFSISHKRHNFLGGGGIIHPKMRVLVLPATFRLKHF